MPTAPLYIAVDTYTNCILKVVTVVDSNSLESGELSCQHYRVSMFKESVENIVLNHSTTNQTSYYATFLTHSMKSLVYVTAQRK